MDNKEQDQAITDLEIQLDRLRALYEQYFMGIERIEPQVPRKTVERIFQMLRKERIRNTALRFRFMQLVQRYNTMETYWRRVVRMIEEGTYRRVVMTGAKRPSKAPPPEQNYDVDLREFDEDTNPSIDLGVPPELGEGVFEREERTDPSIAELMSDSGVGQPEPQGRQAPPPHGHRPPPRQQHGARPPEPKLPEDRIQAIYRDYVSARQRCNQTTHGLTLERVTQQIRSQEDALRKKHGKDVDFQVVVRDGRAILKAVQKE
jgi:hypothetical protein